MPAKRLKRRLSELALFSLVTTQLLSWIVGAAIFIPRLAFAAAPICNGQAATIYVEGGVIVSTIAADNGDPYTGTLNGGNDPDVIVGTSGNDTINGGNQNDTICGGDGNDTINGENGKDTIFGENGNDSIRGGNGGDDIDGGNDVDFCTGDGGPNIVNCEAAAGQGIIIIRKNAVPDSAEDFSFSGTTPIGTFQLDDDADGTLPNQQSFSLAAAAAPGGTNYNVMETPIPAGWSLTGISCDDAGDASTTTSLETATATINLDEGEIITCTFTDTQQASSASSQTSSLNGTQGSESSGSSVGSSEASSVASSEGSSAASSTASSELSSVASSVASSELSSSVASSEASSVASSVASSEISSSVASSIASSEVSSSVDSSVASSELSSSIASSVASSEISSSVASSEVSSSVASSVASSEVSSSVASSIASSEISSSVASSIASSEFSSIASSVASSEISSSVASSVASSEFSSIASSIASSEISSSVASSVASSELSSSIASSIASSEASSVASSEASSIASSVASSASSSSVISNGTLHVIKEANGGDATFGFEGADITSFEITTSSGSGSMNLSLPPGTYSVNEVGIPAGWELVSNNCQEIVVASNQTANCTVTNQKKGNIIVVKQTIPDSSTGSFVFSANYSGTGFTLSDGQQNDSGPLSPGSYSVSETPVAGWQTQVVCSDQSDPSNIQLSAGETVTCTFTNQQTPTLTVTKVVMNDSGGSKVVGDFPLFVNGNPVTSGLVNAFPPGSYVVSETATGGYVGTFSDNCSSTGSVVLAFGDSKTCTVTNDDVQPLLTVTKIVVNDNGGTAQVSDFILKVDATIVTSAQQNGFNAGIHLVSETGSGGYSTAFGGDCTGSGTIILAVGDVKNCTITNDDQQGTLTIVKTVVNDNGGTAVAADFPLFVDGNPATNNTPVGVNAGAHTVSETTQTGYSAGAWGGDCAADGSVTVGPGENKTCTITNDDQPATLVVIKHVINDTGATRVASEFTINVTGTNVSDPSFPGSETGVTISLDAGNYSVDEDVILGYAKTLSVDCSGTIGVGETKTCTVTNNDTIPMCNGLLATIVGTPGSNILIGSGESDVIVGRGGNDIVFGGGGNDTICLGNGNDVVLTGGGGDWIDAGGGRNVINAGGGGDTVLAGNGDDTVLTLGGSDTVNVGGGNNNVGTGGGSDTITTGNGNDNINAGSGNDTCEPGGGTNNLLSCETILP